MGLTGQGACACGAPPSWHPERAGRHPARSLVYHMIRRLSTWVTKVFFRYSEFRCLGGALADPVLSTAPCSVEMLEVPSPQAGCLCHQETISGRGGTGFQPVWRAFQQSNSPTEKSVQQRQTVDARSTKARLRAGWPLLPVWHDFCHPSSVIR